MPEREYSINDNGYRLIDTGNGRKLEQFGKYILIRPISTAIWRPAKPELWKQANAEFYRSGKDTGTWKTLGAKPLPPSWILEHNGLKYNIEPNSFGNLGLFPEHWLYQTWITRIIDTWKYQDPTKPIKILNLFSYSGSNSLKTVTLRTEITNVDSSKQSMHLLTRNLEINGLAGKTRLILEDAKKFMQREIKKGNKYDGIMLDPPTFGRGPTGEIFKIETDVNELIDMCQQLAILDRSFVVFTCHTPGLLPSTLQNLFFSTFNQPAKAEELVLSDIAGRNLPAGIITKICLDKSYKESVI